MLIGINTQELRTLDHYEGMGEGSYRRVIVKAFILDQRSQMQAYMYVKNE